jgi:hypothetical protein
VHFGDGVDLQEGQTYHKIGSSSGYTTGVYSGLKEAIIHRVLNPHTRLYETFPTLEYAIFKSAYPFMAQGDSGSLVYNGLCGNVVGPFFAASKPQGHSYITPIDDFFQDIMKVSGASKVRMAF